MSSTTQKGPNDLETLHDAARRLLQELERRVKRPSGREGDAHLEPPPSPTPLDVTDVTRGDFKCGGYSGLFDRAGHRPDFQNVGFRKASHAMGLAASSKKDAVELLVRFIFSSCRPTEMVRCDASRRPIAATMCGFIGSARGTMDGLTYEPTDLPLLAPVPNMCIARAVSGERPNKTIVAGVVENSLLKEPDNLTEFAGHSLRLHRERPERIEPEAKGWEETSQTSGIRERITERGFEIGGGPLDLGCNSFSFEASEDANGPDAGSILSTDRGECEHSLPYVFSEFDLRAVPRRAWLGGGDPLPRPSSRLLIGCNDNRGHSDLAKSPWNLSAART